MKKIILVDGNFQKISENKNIINWNRRSVSEEHDSIFDYIDKNYNQIKQKYISFIFG